MAHVITPLGAARTFVHYLFPHHSSETQASHARRLESYDCKFSWAAPRTVVLRDQQPPSWSSILAESNEDSPALIVVPREWGPTYSVKASGRPLAWSGSKLLIYLLEILTYQGPLYACYQVLCMLCATSTQHSALLTKAVNGRVPPARCRFARKLYVKSLGDARMINKLALLVVIAYRVSTAAKTFRLIALSTES